MTKNNKGRIFSGIQPTGNLHLGNYLGAIKQWVKLQDNYESLFCIVDLHAITVPQDPAELRESTLNMIAIILAAGIDPKNSIIYPQSKVKEHSELAWILGCRTPMGWLNRMTQFKEKAGKHKDRASLGLYAYPVLMAADILLYKATHVPVGDDQKQHLELAREIANSFNYNAEKEIFPEPDPVILSQAKRVMSLRDGKKKMSKSDESDYSRINLTDSADEILLKFKKAKTDSGSDIAYDPENRPEIANLLTIYSDLADQDIQSSVDHFSGKGFAQLKIEVAEIVIEKLKPISAEYNKYLSDKKYLMQVADQGSQKAQSLAAETIREVKQIVGFLT